jgi:DNA (cytosine-5)-methyltransferase 1
MIDRNTNVQITDEALAFAKPMLAPVRVLNLYACLGGNRLLWENCEVTAVELDPELARLYKERFPNDNVIVADAHQYLLDHYKEFDFIWSSPPCPSHSRARYWNSSNYDTTTEAIYPDMKLYEEILFLHHYYRTGKYVVENVISFYEPLIPAQKRGRHLYWCNFNLPSDLGDRRIQIGAGKDELKRLCEFHKIDISTYKGEQSMIKVARNLVDFEAGKTIYNTARNIMNQYNIKTPDLFGGVF